jgi:light-regulated signal transduction histidine kinase (bacteriophytochrome)
MAMSLTDDQVKEALASCADEPVHIPGTIQPFGCLIATHVSSGDVTYASENIAEYLSISAAAALGKPAQELVGREVWHGVRNAIGRANITEQAINVGEFMIRGKHCALRVHRSADNHVIEIEPAIQAGMEGSNALKTLTYLMTQIQDCETEEELFNLTCELMQHLSGYDRVLIYRFDPDFNGEVLAEAKRGPQESFLGLRFPHWDIPAQARAIMAKLPLRFIQSVDQVPVSILARPDAPPLDISLAQTRGVSTVHMEYLRNMETASTLTLSVMVENELWGIISFHHSRPKVPAPDLRDVLVGFLQVFNGKLLALRQMAALRRIEALDSGFVGRSEADQSVEALLPSAAPLILKVLSANGLAAVTSGEIISSGVIPEPVILQKLTDLALSSGEVIAIESLAERFPEHSDKLGGAAGALVAGVLPDRAVCIFRNEVKREVAWAGDPAKTAEKVDGKLRLSPRGSFSTFLEQVSGRCERWSDNDVYLIRHLRTLLHAAERQAMMETMNRQQALMIGELNHRVRNILALVRSVSRQARRRYGSLNSYANAIENRIRALAATHDLSGGRSTAPVAVRDLIMVEFEPFRTITRQQALIEGEGLDIRPEVAPIMSLVFHELTTNAAKYGALSVEEGRVVVTLSTKDEDLVVDWRETGGPTANEPNEYGFGMALIKQAIPHELGGLAEVQFTPEGLHAHFILPGRHFTKEAAPPASHPVRPIEPEEEVDLSAALSEASVLLLEDNFIIAKETADQLYEMGCSEVRTVSNIDQALEVLQDEKITLAVLDVNLGPEVTSEAVALRLLEQEVPFIFVTGYGEDISLSPELDSVPRLTKPIAGTDLLNAITRRIGG